MIPRKLPQTYDMYPWNFSDISIRGGTAPRPDKTENFYLPCRVPTSSSKYNKAPIPSLKVSMKGSGWSSYRPRDTNKSITSGYRDSYSIPRPQFQNPNSPEVIEHISEEGGRRPKTQNEKCRRKNSASVNSGSDTVDIMGKNDKVIYDVPIIVVRENKSRRRNSAFREGTAQSNKRPSTFKPGKSVLISSLDRQFLDLFQM